VVLFAAYSARFLREKFSRTMLAGLLGIAGGMMFLAL
jgi:hypothetical protein